MIEPTDISETLLFSTVQITTFYADGTSGSGTGFFFHVLLPDDRHAILLMTNRHVVAGAITGRMLLHSSENEERGFQTHFTICR